MYQTQGQLVDSAARARVADPVVGSRRSPSRMPRRAISLLETTIAVAILGIGLIMVAGVFPAALYQHRETAAQADANRLISKAEALIRARVPNDALWFDTSGRYDNQDTPWYLLPTTNLQVGATDWDVAAVLAPPSYTLASTYANVINGVTDSALVTGTATPTLMFGTDTLSDRNAPFTAGNALTPFTDEEFNDAAHRYTWCGFYRRTASGTFNYAVAVCRAQRDQIFVQQNLGENTASSLASEAMNPYSMPSAAGIARRLPVPWRVSVTYYGGHRLGNAPVDPMLGGGVSLNTLAPRGSLLMIQGAVHEEPAVGTETSVQVPAGRILTVVDSPCAWCVEVREDISDLPLMDVYGDASKLVTFDVWVIPPALLGNSLTTNSPVIEWKQVL